MAHTNPRNISPHIRDAEWETACAMSMRRQTPVPVSAVGGSGALVPSLARLRLSVPTAAPNDGDENAEGLRVWPLSPAEDPGVQLAEQMLGEVKAAAQQADAAKANLAQVQQMAVGLQDTKARAEKKMAAASNATKSVTEQQRLASEEADRDELIERARLAKEENLRLASVKRVQDVMQKLEWPNKRGKNKGQELTEDQKAKLLKEHYAAHAYGRQNLKPGDWAGLARLRTEFRKQLEMIEDNERWRNKTRPLAQAFGKLLRIRKAALAKSRANLKKQFKNRKKMRVEQQRADRQRLVAANRSAADAAAKERIANMAARVAQVDVQEAEEEVVSKCEDALGKLHEMRAELKDMARKFGAAMADVEGHCDAKNPDKGVHDKWMLEIMVELGNLESWIENNEKEHPGDDGWDVEEHRKTMLRLESEDESEGGDESEGEGENNPFWQEKGATRGSGNLFDDIDARDPNSHKGFGADEEDDDEDSEYQMNILITTADSIPNVNSEQAEERAHKFAEAFLKMLNVHEETRAMTEWNRANLVAYPMSPDTILLSVQLTLELVEIGRAAAEAGATRPYDTVQGHLEGISPDQWKDATGVVVTNVEGTGIPAVNDEEADWLDENMPGWEEVDNQGRLLNLIMQAQTAIQNREHLKNPTLLLKLFDPTDGELSYVRRQYAEQLQLPADWLTATVEGLDDGMKLAMLTIARESFQDEDAKRKDEGDDTNMSGDEGDGHVDEDMGVME